jgi:hypothetical protein
VAFPVSIRGRFFHPKLVIIAGRAADGRTWVYLAVSSANLTLSGWGRNVESFGETWIHSRRQQSWKVLDDFLAWLGTRSSLTEKPADSDAASRIRAALSDIPDEQCMADDGESPWSGTLHASFYISIVHKSLSAFLKADSSRPVSELRVYSPYWADVAAQVAAFDAERTLLVPALRRDGGALGLAKEQAAELGANTEVLRNQDDVGTRFWHMKAYRIQDAESVRTAVGSCNFTSAGLSGGGAGNVEAMLVFDGDSEWLPKDRAARDEELADHAQAEEETPEPAPISIMVAWDWRSDKWRWRLCPAGQQRDFELRLPGLTPFAIEEGIHDMSGSPPARGATFTVSYHTQEGAQQWQGQIVELNLDHSSRSYGRPLTAADILESWRSMSPTPNVGRRAEKGESDEVDVEDEGEPQAAFDAMNLYEFYRSMRALRAKLQDLQSYPDILRGYLVGRPDSVMALAHLANGDDAAPVVRYLVLRELYGVIETWKAWLDQDLVASVEQMTERARARTKARLVQAGVEGQKASGVLDWVENELGRFDGGLPA